jgi:hypothetical protein
MAERPNSFYKTKTNTYVSMLPRQTAPPPASIVRSHKAVLAHGIDLSKFPGVLLYLASPQQLTSSAYNLPDAIVFKK